MVGTDRAWYLNYERFANTSTAAPNPHRIIAEINIKTSGYLRYWISTSAFTYANTATPLDCGDALQLPVLAITAFVSVFNCCDYQKAMAQQRIVEYSINHLHDPVWRIIPSHLCANAQLQH